MKTKKVLSAIISLVVLLSVFSACSGTSNSAGTSPAGTPAAVTPSAVPAAETPSAAAEVKVGLIALEFGTQSFNDDIMDGLNKAKADLGVDVMSLEVPEVSDTANSLRTLIGQGANLLIVPSSDYRDGMEAVAAEYPDTSFVYLAEMIENSPSNIMSVAYRENEAAFLAGVMGGLLTKTNSIGAILAIGEPVQYRYQYGFMAGAKAVNPSCDVQIAFTNSYTDVGKGNELAGIMYNKADYVGTYAGACNLGVFEAASNAGEGKYCFGAAKGQFDQMPDKIMASVVKPVDLAVYTIIEEFKAGTFVGGAPKSLGLKEKGVNFKFTPEADLLATVPDDVMAVVEALRQKVLDGEIDVPGTKEAFEAFTYSYTK